MVAFSSTISDGPAGAGLLQAEGFAGGNDRDDAQAVELRVPPTVPDSIFQARTAFLPVSPVSALAKQEPVKTSQVRASTYWPRTVAGELNASRMGSEQQAGHEFTSGRERMLRLIVERIRRLRQANCGPIVLKRVKG